MHYKVFVTSEHPRRSGTLWAFSADRPVVSLGQLSHESWCMGSSHSDSNFLQCTPGFHQGPERPLCDIVLKRLGSCPQIHIFPREMPCPPALLNPTDLICVFRQNHMETRLDVNQPSGAWVEVTHTAHPWLGRTEDVENLRTLSKCLVHA